MSACFAACATEGADPGADGGGGLGSAGRIRQAIADLVVCDASGARIPLTASIGVAERRPNEALDVTIDRADRAMYCAKIDGRNRVCLSETILELEEVVIPESGMSSAA